MKLIFNFATLDITVIAKREEFGPWAIYVSNEVDDFAGGLSASRRLDKVNKERVYATYDSWRPYELKRL